MQRADHDSAPDQLELFPIRDQVFHISSSGDLHGLVDALAKLGTGGGFKNFFRTDNGVGTLETEIWISVSFSPRKPVQREDAAHCLKQNSESTL
jgi:hypothetical protein